MTITNCSLLFLPFTLESLLISSFGLQITTTSFIGKKASLFLETDSVDAVAIHEGISMVSYSLCYLMLFGV